MRHVCAWVMGIGVLALGCGTSGKKVLPDGGAAGQEGGPGGGAGMSGGAGAGAAGSSGLGGVGASGGGAGLGAPGGSGGGSSGGAGGDGSTPTTAALFVTDSNNGLVYRYEVTPTTAPVLSGTIDAAPSPGGIAVSPVGELFVAEYVDPSTILRFGGVRSTPVVPNGTIASFGGRNIESLAFVDGELWALSSAYRACNTDPYSIVRLAFSAGEATAVGTVTPTLNGANRGMLWDDVTRVLFVTQCENQRAIQRLQVSADHQVTALAPFTGDALNNPHGMVITPWRELILANAGFASTPGTSLARFLVAPNGDLTANGTIDGNGLDLPVGLALAPWGELFAVNNGDATISRFTFDDNHAAVPHGTFKMEAPTTAQSLGVGWAVFVSGTN